MSSKQICLFLTHPVCTTQSVKTVVNLRKRSHTRLSSLLCSKIKEYLPQLHTTVGWCI